MDELTVIKTSFHTVCKMYGVDSITMDKIAAQAGVDERVIEKMFIGIAVHRADAEKILAALSTHTVKSWTLDNTKVALLPTFTELASTHNLDLSNLAMQASVAYDIIDKLQASQPIPIRDARLVLQVVSRITGKDYTPDTVDVKTIGEEQHD